MKSAFIAAALLALGAPAMAGGISGGVRNSYFNNHSVEHITSGHRNIDITRTSDVTWCAESESHKSFTDLTGSLEGVTFSYSETGSFTDGPGQGANDSSSGSFNKALLLEDPSFQVTSSSGYTNSYMSAYGTDRTVEQASIRESYYGTNTSNEEGHEATSFASSF